MRQLGQHNITISRDRVVLRPLTEDDWGLVHKWWNDPEIGYYSDALDNPDYYTLDQLKDILRSISAKAFCFVIEHDGSPIGDCWLQQMNLERVLEQNQGRDCRRIDLEIEKEFWGRGIGTEAIHLLVELGFRREKADAIFGVEITDYNPRSLKAFQKAGFEICETIARPEGGESGVSYDVVLMREGFDRAEGAGPAALARLRMALPPVSPARKP